MGKLLWDGDEEPNEDADEIDSGDESVELEEVNPPDIPEEPDENTEEPEMIDSLDECQHPWQFVSREKMKRVVQGSTIDTKSIYWCNSCKSILDIIE